MGTILAILQAIGMVRNMFGSNGEMQSTNSSLDYSLPDVGVRRNYQ